MSEMEPQNYVIQWALTAPDDEVGPACMKVPVPPTTANDPEFREAYEQGYRHALADVRSSMKLGEGCA